MQESAEQILRTSAGMIRAARWRSLVDSQDAEAARTQYSATIVKYDALQSLWMCKLPDGSIIPARSISPGGSKGNGDVVSLYKPAQGMAVIRSLS